MDVKKAIVLGILVVSVLMAAAPADAWIAPFGWGFYGGFYPFGLFPFGLFGCPVPVPVPAAIPAVAPAIAPAVAPACV